MYYVGCDIGVALAIVQLGHLQGNSSWQARSYVSYPGRLITFTIRSFTTISTITTTYGTNQLLHLLYVVAAPQYVTEGYGNIEAKQVTH